MRNILTKMFMGIIFILIIILFVTILSMKRFNTILNPISLYSLSFFLTLSAALFGDSFSEVLNIRVKIELSLLNVSLIYLLSVIVFCVPWILKDNKHRRLNILYIKDAQHMRLMAYVLITLLLMVLLSAMVSLGRLPIYDMINGTINIRDHIDSLKQLPIGVMALISWFTVLAATVFPNVLSRKKYYGKPLVIYFILVLLLAVLWQGNRQFILLTLFLVIVRSMEIAYSSDSRSKLRSAIKYTSIGVMFIITFITIQHVRLQGVGSNVFELLMYLAWPTLNMSNIVSSVSPLVFSEVPLYTVIQIVPNRLLAEGYGSNLSEILFEPTSPSGYLSIWYLDYGVFGVIVGSFILGYVSKKTYNIRYKSESWLRVNNLVLWICVTSGIYSHFMHFNFFIMPLILLITHGYFFHKGQRANMTIKSQF